MCSEIHNNQWLYAMSQWHNWNDVQTVVHKIEIARNIYHIQNENRSVIDVHDDKRYIIPGSIDTLPWRYYKIL